MILVDTSVWIDHLGAGDDELAALLQDGWVLGHPWVAGDLAISERQLRRRVTAAVGYGPKRLARVLRLRRALTAAEKGAGLARAALGAGYADQAHFANDCRELAGVAPSVMADSFKTASAPVAMMSCDES